jgi:hypothetical protein
MTGRERDEADSTERFLDDVRLGRIGVRISANLYTGRRAPGGLSGGRWT